MFKKLVSLLLVIVMLLSLVGCGDSYMDAYIYFELEYIPSTLDPQLVSTREEYTIVRSIFDTLLRYNDEGTLRPSAASSFEKNGLTYKFTISEDACWKNGDKLTAYDFEYAFKRALDPETAAPAAATLSSVQSAVAENENTFVVTLSYDDPDFLNTLTLPVTMPCNEKYFNESKGRYCREIDYTPACGSYYIRKWENEDKFLIRLAKFLDYKGEFEARSMRVYYTVDKRNNIEMLKEADTDISYIPSEDLEKAESSGLKTSSSEVKTYMLFLSPDMDESVRSALHKSVKIAPNALTGFPSSTPAKNIAPSVLNADLPNFSADFPYDVATSISLYTNAVLNDSALSLLGGNLKCYSDEAALTVARSVVAHWQQNLGAFMNIEEVSSLDSLKSDYKNGNYTAIILPMSADISHCGTYLSQFKTDADSLSVLQQELGENALGTPLFNQSVYTSATALIQNFETIIHGGIPDVALAIKKE